MVVNGPGRTGHPGPGRTDSSDVRYSLRLSVFCLFFFESLCLSTSSPPPPPLPFLLFPIFLSLSVCWVSSILLRAQSQTGKMEGPWVISQTGQVGGTVSSRTRPSVVPHGPRVTGSVSVSTVRRPSPPVGSGGKHSFSDTSLSNAATCGPLSPPATHSPDGSTGRGGRVSLGHKDRKTHGRRVGIRSDPGIFRL